MLSSDPEYRESLSEPEQILPLNPSVKGEDSYIGVGTNIAPARSRGNVPAHAGGAGGD